MTEEDGSRPEPMVALGRAATRAAYHLLRAGVEGLKAVQAVVDELGRLNDPPSPQDRPSPKDRPNRVRIDLE